MIKFYVVEPADGKMFGTKWAYGEPIEPIIRGESQKCPVCGGPVSMRNWLPPYRIRLSSSKPAKWGDLLWGAGFQLLVSRKFKELYTQEKLSGIKSFSEPVEVVHMGLLKSGQFPITPPEYYLVNIPWGGANQDDSASGLTHEHPEVINCSYCRVGVTWRKQDRLVIEEGSWNGHDFFKPRNAPVPFMVSERFKVIAEKYKLNNVWFISGEKFSYDENRPGLWFIN